jgi:hypothetical protein
MGANERDGVVFKQPTTLDQRREVASACVKGMKLSIPMLVDGMDNAVGEAYAGWPDRLYIVGRDGKVAYKGRPGPGGFQPREMEQALRKLLTE